MSAVKAVEIVGGWPRDRSAPRRLHELIEAANGNEKQQLEMLVEALIVASVTKEDNALIQRYFG